MGTAIMMNTGDMKLVPPGIPHVVEKKTRSTIVRSSHGFNETNSPITFSAEGGCETTDDDEPTFMDIKQGATSRATSSLLCKNNIEGHAEPNFDPDGLAKCDSADRFESDVEDIGDPDNEGCIEPNESSQRQYTEEQLASLGAERLATLKRLGYIACRTAAACAAGAAGPPAEGRPRRRRGRRTWLAGAKVYMRPRCEAVRSWAGLELANLTKHEGEAAALRAELAGARAASGELRAQHGREAQALGAELQAERSRSAGLQRSLEGSSRELADAAQRHDAEVRALTGAQLMAARETTTSSAAGGRATPGSSPPPAAPCGGQRRTRARCGRRTRGCGRSCRPGSARTRARAATHGRGGGAPPRGAGVPLAAGLPGRGAAEEEAAAQVAPRQAARPAGHRPRHQGRPGDAEPARVGAVGAAGAPVRGPARAEGVLVAASPPRSSRRCRTGRSGRRGHRGRPLLRPGERRGSSERRALRRALRRFPGLLCALRAGIRPPSCLSLSLHLGFCPPSPRRPRGWGREGLSRSFDSTRPRRRVAGVAGASQKWSRGRGRGGEGGAPFAGTPRLVVFRFCAAPSPSLPPVGGRTF
ncbi:unnamed protein product [Prorocentrum cordatum]|uniref:Centrosomal protein POC5 n=1 Tax=Prorocentrum cordatum TaxID=2364126 RepID=A0ABN9UF71_9DINO|nr:unnamed protein product [Polarella glacialis]